MDQALHVLHPLVTLDLRQSSQIFTQSLMSLNETVVHLSYWELTNQTKIAATEDLFLFRSYLLSRGPR